MSGRGVTLVVGFCVVAGIASNMAFTNPGMSSVVSRREGVVGCPLRRFPDDGPTVVSSSRSDWRFCPTVAWCCLDVARVFTPLRVVEFLDFLPLNVPRYWHVLLRMCCALGENFVVLIV